MVASRMLLAYSGSSLSPQILAPSDDVHVYVIDLFVDELDE